jgi:hypothetical protein
MTGRAEADLIAAARHGDDAVVDYLVPTPANCDD